MLGSRRKDYIKERRLGNEVFASGTGSFSGGPMQMMCQVFHSQLHKNFLMIPSGRLKDMSTVPHISEIRIRGW